MWYSDIIIMYVYIILLSKYIYRNKHIKYIFKQYRNDILLPMKLFMNYVLNN